jgi:hypothetical protein
MGGMVGGFEFRVGKLTAEDAKGAKSGIDAGGEVAA